MFGVSTGVDSFENPQDIEALFPFPDIDWLFVVIAVVLWLAWHVVQIRAETRENNEACEMYDEISLERAMLHGGSALIATDEEWAAHRERGDGHPPHRTERPQPGSTRPDVP